MKTSSEGAHGPEAAGAVQWVQGYSTERHVIHTLDCIYYRRSWIPIILLCLHIMNFTTKTVLCEKYRTLDTAVILGQQLVRQHHGPVALNSLIVPATAETIPWNCGLRSVNYVTIWWQNSMEQCFGNWEVSVLIETCHSGTTTTTTNPIHGLTTTTNPIHGLNYALQPRSASEHLIIEEYGRITERLVFGQKHVAVALLPPRLIQFTD